MDYEKEYKDAMARMELCVRTGLKITPEYIFPEIAESEDERIRKELKEAFEAYDIESTWNGIPIRSIFAWLEKQKEQKPGEIPPYVTGIKGEPDPPGISDLEQAAKEYSERVSGGHYRDLTCAFIAGAEWAKANLQDREGK